MAGLTGWSPTDDGQLAFARDDGTSFTLPATPAAVGAAVQLDSQAGALKPMETYGQLVRGAGLGPQATGPEALAQGDAGAAGAGNNWGGGAGVGGGAPVGQAPKADFGEGFGASVQPSFSLTEPNAWGTRGNAGPLPPASPAHDSPAGPKLSAAQAAQADFFAQPGPGASGAGGSSIASFAADVPKAAAEFDARKAATIADVNATRTAKGLAPLVTGPDGTLVEATTAGKAPPAQVDPGARVTLPTSGGGSFGVAGVGGYARDPMLQQMMDDVRRNNGRVVGRLARGYQSQGKVVESELGPSAAAFDDMAKQSEHVVGLKAELARREGYALEGKVNAQDLAIAKFEEERKKALTAYDQEGKRLERLVGEAEKGEVDPSRYWKNQGAWGQLVGALSILAGAMGGALDGTKRNQALEIISRRVDEDIAAQDPHKKISASERRLDATAKRLGSLQSAIDYERLQRHVLVDSRLAQMEQAAQGDDEKGNLGIIRAQNNARMSELAMQIDARRNGTAKETYKFSQGGAVYALNPNQAFDRQVKLMELDLKARGATSDEIRARAQAMKDAREAQPETAVYNGEQVALKVDKGEAEKVRKTLASIKQMDDLMAERDKLNTIGTRLSPEQSARFDQINRSISAHQSTIDDMGVLGETERQEMRDATRSYLAGKGLSDAMRQNIHAKARAVLEQTGAGVVRNGQVVPLMGQK